MAVSTNSEFVDFITPLGDRMKLYDPTSLPTNQPKNNATDPAKALPQGFIDAMIVREEVYVREQNVPLENELDENDERSFHWVAYASVSAKNSAPLRDEKMEDARRRSSASTKIPIGTIRLVPPPHPPHANGRYGTDVHDSKEAYAKLGRLAVVKEFRKAGISSLLINTALSFAKNHPYDLTPQRDAAKAAILEETGQAVGVDFRGLVLVHSQTGVQKLWRKYGFETDESMGNWDEEGIDHVGMWKRVDVSGGRRKSKAWLGPTPTKAVE